MAKNKVQFSAHKKKGWFSKPQPGHLVQFYNSDDNLLVPLTEFVSSGLLSGDSCVIIATPSHLQRLNDQLSRQGVDVSGAQLSGQYVALDAQETLAKFMVNNLPDRKLFLDLVGTLVGQFTQKGKPIRAYGEMVALLWKEDKKDAVIQLENFWNELADMHNLSLFCAYPELHFLMNKDAREEIDNCHNVTLSGFAAA